MLKFNAQRYIYVAVVLLLLIFFHYLSWLNPIESILGESFKPLAKVFYSLSLKIKLTFSRQNSSQDLARNLAAAESKIIQLTAENAKFKFLEEENSVLRKSLNFLAKEKQPFLLANIIYRGEFSGGAGAGQSVVIDRGAKDGLFSGLPVVGSNDSDASGQGIIIGKVVSVKDDLAEIYLVTNNNCKLAAAILGENKTSGIARGDLGLTVKMEFIPQTKNIKIGDLVATSGLEQNIPRGLIIGRISEVAKENNEVWQSATIEPIINLDSLSIVSILLP